MFTHHRSRRRGLALILSLLLVFASGIIIMALLGMASHERRMTSRHNLRQAELSAAEMAVNKVYAELLHFLEFGVQNLTTAVASIQPPAVTGMQYSGFEVTSLGAVNETPTSGPFVGLTLFTENYKVEVTALSTAGDAQLLAHPGVSVRQDIKVRYVPLWVYGIFYDPHLEIAPGPVFTESGRVHTNGNLYVGSGSTLTFQNYVSAHGNIIHGYHPNDLNHVSPQTGTVNYWTGTSALTDLVGGSYLDSRAGTWLNDALARWNGHVLDSAMGMPELPLPIPQTNDPHDIIEPANASDPYSLSNLKFANQAGLAITVSGTTVTATNKTGTPVSLTYDHDANPATPQQPIYTLSTFRDNREGQNVTTLDINVQRLAEAGITPANGIVYVNHTGGVRMTNAAQLPAPTTVSGLTVATNGPMWVQGDYNTVNTQLALLAGDSINILSNSWSDANSTLALSSRTPTNTEVRSVILAGNVPTDADTQYSGGVENYFRFHENWNGTRTVRFRGSIVNLWDSEVATANWQYGGSVYTAPIRDWNWDSIYGGLAGPPGMPRVYFIERQDYREVDPTT